MNLSTPLTIEIIRNAISSTTEQNQTVQDQNAIIFDAWYSNPQYYIYCIQLFAERISIREIFMAACTATQLVKLYYSILGDKLLEIYENAANLLVGEFKIEDKQCLEQILRLLAVISGYIPDLLNHPLLNMLPLDQKFIYFISFDTDIFNSMVKMGPFKNNFVQLCLQLLDNSDPCPEWFRLLSIIVKIDPNIANASVFLPKIQSILDSPTCFQGLCEILGNCLDIEYINLSDEEIQFLQNIITAVLTSATNLLNNPNVDASDVVSAIFQIFSDIADYGGGDDFNLDPKNLEFFTMVLNQMIYIASLFNEYNEDYIRFIQDILPSLFESLYNSASQNHNSYSYEEFPYYEQFEKLVILFFNTINYEGATLHTKEVGERILKLSNFRPEMYDALAKYLQQFILQQPQYGTCFFSAHLHVLHRNGVAQPVAQFVIDNFNPQDPTSIPYAIDFISEAIWLLPQEQQGPLCEIAWAIFINEPTYDHAMMISNISCHLAAVFKENNPFRDPILELSSSVKTFLINPFYSTLMSPIACVEDATLRAQLFQQCLEIVAAKISSKQDLLKVYQFITTWIEHIGTEIMNFKESERFIGSQSEANKNAIVERKKILREAAMQHILTIFQMMGDALYPDTDELMKKSCKMVRRALFYKLVTQRSVYEFITTSFQNMRTKYVYKILCLMILLPDQLAPFVQFDAIAELDQSGYKILIDLLESLRKIPEIKLIKPEVKEIWSPVNFFTYFNLDFFQHILSMPQVDSKVFALITSFFPIGANREDAPREWALPIAEVIISNIMNLYEDDVISDALSVIYQIAASQLVDANLIKQRILAYEEDQVMAQLFVVMFDMRISSLMHPENVCDNMRGIYRFGRLIIHRARAVIARGQ